MKTSSRKLLIAGLGLCLLGFFIYRSSGFIHLEDFSGKKLLHALQGANPFLLFLSVFAIYVCYAIRALRWRVFQQNLGPSRFWQVYAMTLAGFAAIFLLGRPGEPVRPLLLARKEKLPVADMFGIYVLERLFDFASTAAIAASALLLFKAQVDQGAAAAKLELAARTTGTVFSAAVIGALGFLVYLRLHGSILLERRLQGWISAEGWRARVARIILGFVRGVQTIRTGGELALAVFFSAAHWFLVLLTYVWISRSFGGTMANFSLSNSMLVLAFTLAGSAIQLPGVGGGSQVASFLAYTTIFGVEKEPAAAASIVLWLITFAACSLAGVPLLIREGWSLGELRRMAVQEKDVVKERVAGGEETAAERGDPAK